ncbi:TPA: morphogenetic protein [Serratia marcescens]
MKERPVIFNGEMVRAILNGRKTQTRRAISDRHLHLIDVASQVGECYPLEYGIDHANSQSYYREHCPFGQVGDRLWVREMFASGLCTKTTLAYRATHKREDLEEGWNETIKWTPSIHMPRWASRIMLEITAVRVERLNDISQDDAQAEGMELTGWRPSYSNPDNSGLDETLTPYDNFAMLWGTIYGEENWSANPWVWAISFRRVK